MFLKALFEIKGVVDQVKKERYVKYASQTKDPALEEES